VDNNKRNEQTIKEKHKVETDDIRTEYLSKEDIIEFSFNKIYTDRDFYEKLRESKTLSLQTDRINIFAENLHLKWELMIFEKWNNIFEGLSEYEGKTDDELKFELNMWVLKERQTFIENGVECMYNYIKSLISKNDFPEVIAKYDDVKKRKHLRLGLRIIEIEPKGV
jgi:hypothetical protein